MATRRWRWLAALALCAAVLAGAACGGDDDGDSGEPSGEVPTFPEGSTMARIQERGQLIVGTKFDQPLFGLKNPTNDEIEGFDVEIATLIAEGIFGAGAADGKVRFVETPSKVRETVIRQGRVDIVAATYTINDERKTQVDFAGPYYVAGQDIMVRADEDGIASVDDLNGRKVCSAQGSTSIDNVREQAPQSDLSITFDLYSLCAEALRDGRVDAVSTDNGILAGLVQASEGELKLVEAPFTEEPYGIGLKRGDGDFRTFLNDRLEEIVESGEWQEAFEATVGQVISEVPEPPAVDRY